MATFIVFLVLAIVLLVLARLIPRNLQQTSGFWNVFKKFLRLLAVLCGLAALFFLLTGVLSTSTVYGHQGVITSIGG